MKVLASSSIEQYRESVRALADYYWTVELGLGACFRKTEPAAPTRQGTGRTDRDVTGAVVFGSDQGLVGQFNDVVADYAIQAIRALPGMALVWAVGSRVRARFSDAGLPLMDPLTVPTGVAAITPLVQQILVQTETRHSKGEVTELHLFHNRPAAGSAYEPVGQRLLPLDEEWRNKLVGMRWPKGPLPEVLGHGGATLLALVREHIFISLFRACAESLASENASRLAAMERAEKNISDSLESLQGAFHRVRQGGIDEELFDVVSGSEALSTTSRHEGGS